MSLVTGQTVYVTAMNCKLLNGPSVNGQVLATLHPTYKVTWLGKANREFHQVKYGGLTGYIFFSCLSVKFPNPQYSPSQVCESCKGFGFLPVGGTSVADTGSGVAHPICPKCRGVRSVDIQAFASSGIGTKA